MKTHLLLSVALLTGSLAVVPTASACAEEPIPGEIVCTAEKAADIALGLAKKVGPIGTKLASCLLERSPMDWLQGGPCDVTP